jgi:hypothetical protein
VDTQVRHSAEFEDMSMFLDRGFCADVQRESLRPPMIYVAALLERATFAEVWRGQWLGRRDVASDAYAASSAPAEECCATRYRTRSGSSGSAVRGPREIRDRRQPLIGYRAG